MGLEDDDEAGSDDWEGWEVDSESSDSSSEDGWIDVPSDNEEELAISDSDGEDGNGQKRDGMQTDAPVPREGYGLATEKAGNPIYDADQS